MPHSSIPGCAVQVRLVLEESGTPGRYGKDIQGVQPLWPACSPAAQGLKLNTRTLLCSICRLKAPGKGRKGDP